MSKIFVAGATGRVGQEVVKQLAAAGQEVLAAGRKLDRLPKGKLITPVAFDFTWLPDQMAKLLTGVDAIVFTAGSRGKIFYRLTSTGR
ncbi:NAD(P)H-binding protein [Limosilactobacillus fermentum]|uniref:NAD(P)H-binding protein n=1 Tax=Limosilactobacillus fermentum TaxID=1613 RepID=UPI00352A3C2A